MSSFHRLCLALLAILFLFHPPVSARSDASSNEHKGDIQENPIRADGSSDFDFSLGSWEMHVSRLLHPLSDADEWVQMDGTATVRKIWEGEGHLVEFRVSNKLSHIEGLSLNLFNPTKHQWSLNFANSADGILDPPTVGAFKNGRGDFYGQEQLGEKSVLVRKSYSTIAKDSNRFEEAISVDGGKSWKVNWIATFKRTKVLTGPGASKVPQSEIQQ